MHTLILIFSAVLLFSCNLEKKRSVQTTHQSNKNIISITQYGDSIRIETEKRGDTLIKHYKDLKGLSDDNFDGSFDTECLYRKFYNDKVLNCDFHLAEGDYSICFSKKQIIQYCDSMISVCEKSNEIQENLSARVYKQYKKSVVLKTNEIGIYMLPDLLVNVNFKIINTKANEPPIAILVEYYKTNFSGGKNFSVITPKNDTIPFIHSNEYMK